MCLRIYSRRIRISALLIFSTPLPARKKFQKILLEFCLPRLAARSEAASGGYQRTVSNFNRAQIGLISYPQGEYRPSPMTRTHYPSSVSPPTARPSPPCNLNTQYPLQTAPRRRQGRRPTGHRRSRRPRSGLSWTPRGQVACRTGKWHFPHGCRRQQSRVGDPR